MELAGENSESIQNDSDLADVLFAGALDLVRRQEAASLRYHVQYGLAAIVLDESLCDVRDRFRMLRSSGATPGEMASVPCLRIHPNEIALEDPGKFSELDVILGEFCIFINTCKEDGRTRGSLTPITGLVRTFRERGAA